MTNPIETPVDVDREELVVLANILNKRLKALPQYSIDDCRDRVEIINLVADGICRHCGCLVNRQCHCMNDE